MGVGIALLSHQLVGVVGVFTNFKNIKTTAGGNISIRFQPLRTQKNI